MRATSLSISIVKCFPSLNKVLHYIYITFGTEMLQNAENIASCMKFVNFVYICIKMGKPNFVLNMVVQIYSCIQLSDEARPSMISTVIELELLSEFKNCCYLPDRS